MSSLSLFGHICVFCTNRHNSTECHIYATVAKRQVRLREQKRCYRCLRLGHTPATCQNDTSISCGSCWQNDHHPALCKMNPVLNLGGNDDEFCLFCGYHCGANKCLMFWTFWSRGMRLNELDRCVRCLEHHPEDPCEPECSPCEYCERTTHHKVMCRDNPFLKENFGPDPANGKCIFCRQHKKAENCGKFGGLQNRIEMLAKQGRCKSCLRYHKSDTCVYSSRCQICSSLDHHRVICPENPSFKQRSASKTRAVQKATLESPQSSGDNLFSFDSTGWTNYFDDGARLLSIMLKNCGLKDENNHLGCLSTIFSGPDSADADEARHMSIMSKNCKLNDETNYLGCLSTISSDQQSAKDRCLLMMLKDCGLDLEDEYFSCSSRIH